MGMDRNTTIGFVLIGMLLIAMFYFNSKNRLAFEGEQKRIADSIAKINPPKKPESVNVKIDTTSGIPIQSNAAAFGITETQPTLSVVENDLLKATFSSKGGQIKSVELKKFKKFDGKPVVLNNSDFNKISYRLNVSQNKSSAIEDINFKALPVKQEGKNKVISFEASDSTGKRIIHEYTVTDDDYMIGFKLKANEADFLFSQNLINFTWQVECPQIEQDHAYELTQSHFCFYENQNFDFEYLGKDDSKELKKASWLSVKQQFFLTTFIADKTFSETNTSWKLPTDSNDHYLARVTSNARYNFASGSEVTIPMQIYFGPSDYNILKKYGNHMESIVPYGSGIFAFVKYINRYFLLPVFDFVQRNVASMGIVILLLTLLIRLITSPILYKSYLSGAKMKVLKPEVDALREKYKDDQQAFGMEQMKLWKTAGVSPLGGCLPALLQIPIFMSLYYFFQSNIDLRGKSFLWANDLAQYDSILKIPFEVPFYGDHVSLFTITAVITSLLISLYSMNNMQDNSNPLMKYMPYIFPVLLLGVFNKLPSALTWYYTISNTITLILQIIIQKYIINHDKIMMEIEENRKKPVKKSKMQERIEAMQESQKKLQDLKKKSNGK
jgi:YidC/Oxa1 family membrane protein insertase